MRTHDEHGKAIKGEHLFNVKMLDNAHTRVHFLGICDYIKDMVENTTLSQYHRLIGSIGPRCPVVGGGLGPGIVRSYCYNIDGIGAKGTGLKALDTELPCIKPWPTTIAMHGLLKYVHCNKCRCVLEYSADKYPPFASEPKCAECK